MADSNNSMNENERNTFFQREFKQIQSDSMQSFKKISAIFKMFRKNHEVIDNIENKLANTRRGSERNDIFNSGITELISTIRSEKDEIFRSPPEIQPQPSSHTNTTEVVSEFSNGKIQAIELEEQPFSEPLVDLPNDPEEGQTINKTHVILPNTNSECTDHLDVPDISTKGLNNNLTHVGSPNIAKGGPTVGGYSEKSLNSPDKFVNYKQPVVGSTVKSSVKKILRRSKILKAAKGKKMVENERTKNLTKTLLEKAKKSEGRREQLIAERTERMRLSRERRQKRAELARLAMSQNRLNNLVKTPQIREYRKPPKSAITENRWDSKVDQSSAVRDREYTRSVVHREYVKPMEVLVMRKGLNSMLPEFAIPENPEDSILMESVITENPEVSIATESSVTEKGDDSLEKSYNIDDLKEDDFDDEIEPIHKIPEWASSFDNIAALCERQKNIDIKTVFGELDITKVYEMFNIAPTTNNDTVWKTP